MKLLIKKKYFDLIKAGDKTIDYRDAHITFVCEETGEQLRKRVWRIDLVDRTSSLCPDISELEDDEIIRFHVAERSE